MGRGGNMVCTSGSSEYRMHSNYSQTKLSVFTVLEPSANILNRDICVQVLHNC